MATTQVMTRNPSYSLFWVSALGALGRRFESCRPDSNNPSHRQVSQPVFLLANYGRDALRSNCGQMDGP